MALAADISLKLDASALVSAFGNQLGVHASALVTIPVPDSSGDVGAIASGAASFDVGALGPTIERLAGQIGSGITALGGPGDLFGSITRALDSVELLTAGNLRGDIEALLAQLTAELEGGSRDGGLFGVLLRLSKLLADSPKGATLGALLNSLLGAVGITPPPAVGSVASLLPAIDALVRAIGGLMMLESVLEESQRLTAVVADRLDGPDMQRQFDQLLALAEPTLATRIAATDPADAAAVRATTDGLVQLADRIGNVEQELAAAMGLGEATLAYLDMQQVQQEVAAAAALLRDIDLGQLETLLRNALGGLSAFTSLDFSRAPAQSLDALLAQAEAQVATVAGQVAAWDPAALVEPLTSGIDSFTAPLADLSGLIESAVVSIRAALDAVKRVVVDLPLADLANAVTTLIEPIAQALQAIAALVGDIGAALETAAGEAVAALGAVEGTVDDFQAAVAAVFADARAFVDGLHLDAIAGQLTERIGEFTQALSQAQLKPYFDTAVGAIGSAADVVAAVPFSLLPESMKADVDAAIAPIKAVDLVAFETQIEGMVGIGPDGTFSAREDLDEAIAGIQVKFDALVEVLREHDPQQYLAQLDTQIGELADRIRELAPAVTLQPVQDLIDDVKAQIAGFDVRAQIQPLQDGFDQAIAAVQAYSPAALAAPIEARVTAARQKVLDTLAIEQWSPALDTIHTQAAAALALLDPAQLEGQLGDLLGQAQALVLKLPDGNSPQWIGTIVAALHTGSAARIYPHTFEAVSGWIDSRTGAAALGARSTAISGALKRTHDAVAAIDIAAFAGTLAARLAPVRTATASLAAALAGATPDQARLQAVVLRLDVQADWARLTANRDRYLALLDASLPIADTLARTGLSEVDATLDKLHRCLEPVLTLLNSLRAFVRATGLTEVDAGVPQMLRRLFEVAPPARLAGMTSPIFVAVRERVLALIDAVILPLKTAVARLQTLIAAIDLAPLTQAVDGVFQQVLAEVQALSPQVLLASPLAAVDALKAEVAAFDPLQALLTALDALRDTVARLLDKLSAEKLLADPVAIYREIVDALDALNLQALMAPVTELLDSIAHDVDEGLDETVAAFQRLQDALPSGGGGSSGSVDVEVTT
ncbi:hypothetical protein [Variovorax rhizosphaerae]|uniref:Uncharacterized protein n=1 Tax=Variovorax rhizosphaerae TaxID=1836200 RepID=A0ABU8WRP8_9BURK